jgi:mxaJ protein
MITRRNFVALILTTAAACFAVAPWALRTPSKASAEEPKRVLRVFADPNNLPFSNRREEGFENKIASLIAREMGVELQYNWQALRQGFFRRAFRDGDGDIIMGVPRDIERMLTTAPYYRSTYVFVSRKDRGLNLTSLDDPRLRTLKIGIPIVGGETSNTPPVVALAHRGIVANTVGYTVYGDYEKDNPPARMVDAIANREVDVSILWGPLVGYFARRQPVPLEVTPVAPQLDGAIPFAFDIAIGVDPKNPALRDQINSAMEKNRDRIRQILEEFGVPQVPVEQGSVQRPAEQQASK